MAKQESIGGLWLSAKGHMTGSVTVNGETAKIVVFMNDRATAENRQPTYRIFVSKPKEEKQKDEWADTTPEPGPCHSRNDGEPF